MNARCFDRSISDLFHSADYFVIEGKKSRRASLPYTPSDWDYKKSPFQNTSSPRYITSVTFHLQQAAKEEHERIAQACKKYIAERVNKGHFKYPSAGSVFKNNHAFGAPSGKLIDQCGLKGLQIGGAQIAPFHGNFIINTGNARAKDVKDLVIKAQETVKNKFGFNLEPEIIFV